MRLPTIVYRMEQVLGQHFASLRPAQQTVLALWVYGTVLAKVPARILNIKNQHVLHARQGVHVYAHAFLSFHQYRQNSATQNS
jgi:hypothetical protein